MQFILVSALAFAGIAAAQTNGTAGASSNFAPGYTQSCQAYYDECTRLSGRCQAGLDDCTAKCTTISNTCRTAPGASQATCVANEATCLGKLPTGVTDGASAASSASAAASAAGAMVTTVVSTLTVDCPYATSVTYNGQVYVASSATVLTITNCPCTVTTPAASVGTVPAASTTVPGGAVTTPAVNNGVPKNSTASYTPVAFKGAAGKAAVGGSGFFAGVFGLALFL